MSTNSNRYPAKDALAVAAELCEQLNRLCSRIVVAGSLRRKKPVVGDVEILYVPQTESRPRPGDMFAHDDCDLADIRIQQLLGGFVLLKRPNKIGGFTWGPHNKLAIHKASGIPVDLFAVPEKNWWVSLVVRTGSLETNMRLTTGAQRLGKSLNAYGCGVTNEDGSVTPATSERHVFELCGIPYLEPHER